MRGPARACETSNAGHGTRTPPLPVPPFLSATARHSLKMAHTRVPGERVAYTNREKVHPRCSPNEPPANPNGASSWPTGQTPACHEPQDATARPPTPRPAPGVVHAPTQSLSKGSPAQTQCALRSAFRGREEVPRATRKKGNLRFWRPQPPERERAKREQHEGAVRFWRGTTREGRWGRPNASDPLCYM